uniref:Uncharacterized protein n=1 Tax=Cucumis melo TaxID=3656 RepID=A0A9I9CJV2_CUCME
MINKLILQRLFVSLAGSKKSDGNGSSLQLYEKLSFSYPSLLQPLIHERDTHLAWSLKRSKAVNKSKRVVRVIGRGYMNGVIYAITSDQGNLRFRGLAVIEWADATDIEIEI